jgi:hypothetical protein
MEWPTPSVPKCKLPMPANSASRNASRCSSTKELLSLEWKSVNFIFDTSSERRRDFNPHEQCAAQHTLWKGLTSTACASSAITPRLPDADHPFGASGQTGDLPVPAQGASVHARVYDHAGPFGYLRYRARSSCLPQKQQRRRPGCELFRGSIPGLHASLSTLPAHLTVYCA